MMLWQIFLETVVIIVVVMLACLLAYYVTFALISDVGVARIVNFSLGMVIGFVAMLVWLVRVEIIRHG